MAFFYFLMFGAVPGVWGWLSLPMTGGLIALIVGLVLTWMRPARRLAWMALPFVGSELFLLATGLVAGKFPRDQAYLILLAYLITIAGAVVLLVWRIRESRPAAGALGLGAIGHAFTAAFLSYMVLTGDWI